MIPKVAEPAWSALIWSLLDAWSDVGLRIFRVPRASVAQVTTFSAALPAVLNAGVRSLSKSDPFFWAKTRLVKLSIENGSCWPQPSTMGKSAIPLALMVSACRVSSSSVAGGPPRPARCR